MTRSLYRAMLLDVKLAKSEKQAWAALKGEGHCPKNTSTNPAK